MFANRIHELRSGVLAKNNTNAKLTEDEKTAIASSMWLRGDPAELNDFFDDSIKIGALMVVLRETKAVVQAKEAAHAARQIDQAHGRAWKKVWTSAALALKPAAVPTHPGDFESCVRVRWDFYQAITLALSLVFTPLLLAHAKSTGWSVWHTIELAIDLVLALDIITSACTPFYADGSITLVSEPKPVLLRYIRSSLLLDLLVAFPLGATLSTVL